VGKAWDRAYCPNG